MDTTFGILYVDDESRSLRAFERLFRHDIPVFTATNVQDGLQCLNEQRHKIGILLADQRMPNGSGVSLLEQAYELAPEIVRILVTAYADTASAIDAINRGKISYFIEKPWNVDALREVLSDSLQMCEAKLVQRELLGSQMQELRQGYQSNQMTGFQFLTAGIGHNLSNALASLKHFVEALPAKLGDANLDPHRMGDPSFWVSMQRDAELSAKTISQLAVALREAASVAPFPCDDHVILHELVQETVDAFGDQLRASLIDCRNAVPAALPSVTGNHAQLRRLFSLFVENALAELPSGSKLVWNAEACHSRSGPPSVVLTISDDGNGLDARHLGLPYEAIANQDDAPHLTLKQLVCYMIAYYHDAKIALSENDEGGVTVTIQLPHKPRQVEPADERFIFDMFVPGDQ